MQLGGVGAEAEGTGTILLARKARRSVSLQRAASALSLERRLVLYKERRWLAGGEDRQGWGFGIDGQSPWVPDTPS